MRLTRVARQDAVRPSSCCYLSITDLHRQSIQELSDWQRRSSESINGKLSETFAIPFPPLPEQQRIVGILDEAFEGIATAKANAEKNLQNARALFESHLQSVFTQRGKGWVEKTLGEVVRLHERHHVAKISKASTSKSGVPCIRAATFNDDGIDIDARRSSCTQQDSIAECTTDILEGDRAVLHRRSTLGEVALLRRDDERIVARQRSSIASDCSKRIDATSFSIYFHAVSARSRQCADRRCARRSIKQCQSAKLSTMYSVSAAARRAAERSSRHSTPFAKKPNASQSIYERKLAALEALKKSLLHQAFSGQLYEPSMTTKEPLYESHRSQAPRFPEEVAAVRHSDLPAHLFMDGEGMSPTVGRHCALRQ